MLSPRSGKPIAGNPSRQFRQVTLALPNNAPDMLIVLPILVQLLPCPAGQSRPLARETPISLFLR